VSKLTTTLVELDQGSSDRLLARLEGMDDAEYLWEPVPGCWSVRPMDGGGSGGGRFVAEWDEASGESPPLTTIAARLWHLGARPWPWVAPSSVEDAVRRQFVAPYVPDGADDLDACGTAAEAIASLRAQADERVRHYRSLSDDELLAPLGPLAHRYADADYYDLLLHVVDEQIHHAAEVALLRDLYRVRAGLSA
jgi:hypothetical protein